MSKNGYLDAKKQRERQQREALKRAYEAPCGFEVVPAYRRDGSTLLGDEYLDKRESDGVRAAKPWAYEVRRQKRGGTRPLPSSSFESVGATPLVPDRAKLIDKIATLVDENLFGRSDMCLQFAALLARALCALGVSAVVKQGQVSYRRTSGTWMQWPHAWVEHDGDVLVDGNADSIGENRVIGQGVRVRAYWGPRSTMPDDRQVPAGGPLDNSDFNDPDIIDRWWPALDEWMRREGMLAPAGGTNAT